MQNSPVSRTGSPLIGCLPAHLLLSARPPSGLGRSIAADWRLAPLGRGRGARSSGCAEEGRRGHGSTAQQGGRASERGWGSKARRYASRGTFVCGAERRQAACHRRGHERRRRSSCTRPRTPTMTGVMS